MKLTNKTRGPKIINTLEGPRTLQPGQSGDFEMSKDEAASIERLGFLDPAKAEKKQRTPANPQENLFASLTEEQQADAQKLIDDNKADELRKIAKDEGVEIESDDNKADLAAKIIAKRAEATV